MNRSARRRSLTMPNAAGRESIPLDAWDHLASDLCLAPRELQVVQGVFDDLKEIAIADDLGISPHTVHTYLERVYRKLRVGSRVELVVRVFAAYLDRDPPNALAAQEA